MNHLDDYHARQILLMKQILMQFRERKISLYDFVCEIEAAAKAFENDSEWWENFLAAWGALETVYALKTSENRDNYDQEDKKIISEALNEIDKLTQEKYNIIPEEFLWWNEKIKP